LELWHLDFNKISFEINCLLTKFKHFHLNLICFQWKEQSMKKWYQESQSESLLSWISSVTLNISILDWNFSLNVIHLWLKAFMEMLQLLYPIYHIIPWISRMYIMLNMEKPDTESEDLVRWSEKWISA
jgi:hypothetical protein